MNESKSIIAQELGRRGGQKTKEKYGNVHFKELSKKAAELRKKKKDDKEYDKKNNL